MTRSMTEEQWQFKEQIFELEKRMFEEILKVVDSRGRPVLLGINDLMDKWDDIYKRMDIIDISGEREKEKVAIWGRLVSVDTNILTKTRLFGSDETETT